MATDSSLLAEKEKWIMQIAEIFAIALVAAFSSSMSGAGAGIILFPALLWMHFSYPLVAAISSVNSAAWVLPAASNYLKGREIHWRLIALFSAIGLVGCYIGVLVVVDINQRLLEICVGVMIIFLVVYAYFRKGFGEIRHNDRPPIRRVIGYPISLVLGFYETVFGSGNGILFRMLTIYTDGFDIKDALGHYYIVSFSWAFYAAILLGQKRYYNIPVMVVAAMGSIIGGYLGSFYGTNKPNKFLKLVTLIIGGVLGIKMVIGI